MTPTNPMPPLAAANEAWTRAMNAALTYRNVDPEAMDEQDAWAALIDAIGALTASPLVQPAEPVAMPAGWVPCTITYEEGEDPEEVAFGPQLMMDRLKKWLDAYFAKVYAERYPVATPVQATEVARDHLCSDPRDCPICNNWQPSLATEVASEWIADAMGASVYSRDFAHDVKLNISGDFESADQRLIYAQALAQRLNSSTEVASPVVGATHLTKAQADHAKHLARVYADMRIQAARGRTDADEVAEAHRELCAAIDYLATHSQQEDAQPMPFGWAVEYALGVDFTCHPSLCDEWERTGRNPFPVYRVAPLARRPQTSMQIEEEGKRLWVDDQQDFEAGVRYAEAAHGIVSQQPPEST